MAEAEVVGNGSGIGTHLVKQRTDSVASHGGDSTDGYRTPDPPWREKVATFFPNPLETTEPGVGVLVSGCQEWEKEI